MSQPVHLEMEAKAFAETTANPPYLFDLGPEKGRETLDQVQSSPIDKPDVDVQDLMVPGGPTGEVSVRLMLPRGAKPPLPAVLYIHGAGWVFGNAHTHDRLVRWRPAPTPPSCSPTTHCRPRRSTPRPEHAGSEPLRENGTTGKKW